MVHGYKRESSEIKGVDIMASIMSKLGSLVVLVSMLCCTSVVMGDISSQRDQERAIYWRERGYDFDPAIMSSYTMDQRVKDIKRANYWKERGYDFNPEVMGSYTMDQRVKDIERAKYWKERGYDFNPEFMGSYTMDQRVKDIERAKYWKERGYDFDPEVIGSYMMDQRVKEMGAGTDSTQVSLPNNHIESDVAHRLAEYEAALVRLEAARAHLTELQNAAVQPSTSLNGYDDTPLYRSSLINPVKETPYTLYQPNRLLRSNSIRPIEPISPIGSENTTWTTTNYNSLSTGASTRIGGTQFNSLYGPGGGYVTGTTTQIGGYQFHNYIGSDGSMLSGATTRIGSYDFHNLTNSQGGIISGTSNQIGSTRFHNLYDTSGGYITGTTNQIGNIQLHNFYDSSGNYYTGTTTQIGGDTYTTFP
jgi:hypothetical protein